MFRNAVPNRLRTLVLNADYTPLSACHPVRAGLMVLAHKAYELEPTDIIVQAETTHVCIPAVIVLSTYQAIARRKHKDSPPGRLRVLQRDLHVCQYCGEAARTVDHVVPRCEGGQSSWANMVACCVQCNIRKASLSLKQADMRLRSAPQPPNPSDMMGRIALALGTRAKGGHEAKHPVHNAVRSLLCGVPILTDTADCGAPRSRHYAMLAQTKQGAGLVAQRTWLWLEQHNLLPKGPCSLTTLRPPVGDRSPRRGQSIYLRYANFILRSCPTAGEAEDAGAWRRVRQPRGSPDLHWWRRSSDSDVPTCPRDASAALGNGSDRKKPARVYRKLEDRRMRS
jgi:hypothetical protein